MQLRNYQNEALTAVRKALMSGFKRVLLSAPTGSGKTVIAGTMIMGAYGKGKRVWFLCDNTELVEQSAETFKEFGLDVGIIQGQHEKTDYTKMVQVATPQTLTRRWSRFDQMPEYLPDFIIIDEAHVVYKGHKELLNMLKNVPVVALSATPYTKGLGELYHKLVRGTTTADLVEMGYLSKSKVYAANIPNLKNVKTKSNGDWQEDSLAKTYSNKTITGDIVRTWLKLGENRQTIVFCINVAHSIEVANAFSDAGINCGHIDGYTHKGLREEIINEYKAGDVKVICNVGVLTKGFDAPDTGCLVVARPTKSKMLHYQILGRGLRIAENKDDCIILDHAGNVQRIGFPEDNNPEFLCDGTNGNKNDRQEGEVKTKKCPTCGQVLKVTAKFCACGHEFEFQEKKAEIEIEKGELKLLTPTQRKHIKNSDGESQQAFYSGLVGYAQSKDYKDSYADYKFKDRFGVWPANFKKVPGEFKAGEVAGFIRHMNIKAGFAGRKYG